MTLTLNPQSLAQVLAAADRAARAIPPVWPLASSVAVNPFLGQTGETLAMASARLARVAGVALTLPRSHFRARVEAGEITDGDLQAALARAPAGARPADLGALKAALARPESPPQGALPTLAELAAEQTGIDWPGVIAERFGAFAAAYFDEGQALWAAPRGRSAYAAWRSMATHDLTPEILGLKRFATKALDAPDQAEGQLTQALSRLTVPIAACETYCHRLLVSLGGWAQYARYKLWQAELAGGADATLTDFLAIRLIWEDALFDLCAPQITGAWLTTAAQYAQLLIPSADQILAAILQEAAECAAQRGLAQTLSFTLPKPSERRPALQAAFCIDVRSEVFRRSLESVSADVQTIGFAGFFGLTTAHKRFASDVVELRLPVLLNPGLGSRAGGPVLAAADLAARYKARAARAWGRFKRAAVSSFAFVEAMGPVYGGKLLSDALSLAPGGSAAEPAPQLEPALSAEAKIAAAQSILRAMSLTSGFARLVLLIGHGAQVVNNPHASGLHCGACGGYSGEVNARLLAALLNDPVVREGLAAGGIAIPDDTLFVGALHDTTADQVTLYAEDHPSGSHSDDLNQAKAWLDAAGALTRSERALRLPRATGEASLRQRGRNWAEVRPEWALAGCQAFIAAPRQRTAGKGLNGRAFLHDYDWQIDKGFGVLELILTAPVVVASWISLQYYGSTVAPSVFGGGNKLLHNVTGGIGVVEGNGGLLRVGLPWQSVHDGHDYMHDPLRLSVCIEAPREAMSAILARHGGVRALFDQGWLHLFALDEQGRMAHRYAGEGEWTAVN